MAAEKRIELAYRVECKLPPRLVGDAGRLKQVMLNLLCTVLLFYFQVNELANLFFQRSKCDQVYRRRRSGTRRAFMRSDEHRLGACGV